MSPATFRQKKTGPLSNYQDEKLLKALYETKTKIRASKLEVETLAVTKSLSMKDFVATRDLFGVCVKSCGLKNGLKFFG